VVEVGQVGVELREVGVDQLEVVPERVTAVAQRVREVGQRDRKLGRLERAQQRHQVVEDRLQLDRCLAVVLLDDAADLFGGNAVQARVQFQIGADGEFLVQGERLRHVADPHAGFDVAGFYWAA